MGRQTAIACLYRYPLYGIASDALRTNAVSVRVFQSYFFNYAHHLSYTCNRPAKVIVLLGLLGLSDRSACLPQILESQNLFEIQKQSHFQSCIVIPAFKDINGAKYPLSLPSFSSCVWIRSIRNI